MWCGVRSNESDTERERVDAERDVCMHMCGTLEPIDISRVCVVGAELLLVFIHQEANVSPAEVLQGSLDSGGCSAR